MSLILEALKKVERDRHTQERGFLVLAQPSWTSSGERAWTRSAPLLGGAALAGAALAAALLWPARSRQSAAPSPPPVNVAAAVAQPPVPVPPPSIAAPRLPLAGTVSPAPAPRIAWPPASHGTAPRSVAPPVTQPADETTQPETSNAAEPAAEDLVAPEPAPIPGPLRLEAVSQRDGAPVAVVSGQMVRVGDRIGASTVVRIGAAEVELETDGKRHVLKF